MISSGRPKVAREGDAPVIFGLSVVLCLAARTYSDTQTEENVLYPAAIRSCKHVKLPRGR